MAAKSYNIRGSPVLIPWVNGYRQGSIPCPSPKSTIMKRVYVHFKKKKWVEYFILGNRLIRSDLAEWSDPGSTEAVFRDSGDGVDITIGKKNISLNYLEAQSVLAILTHTSDTKIKIK